MATPHKTAGPEQCLDALLGRLIEIDDQIVELLRRHSEVEPDGQEAVEIEHRTAALLAEVLERGTGLIAEGERQGVPPEHLDALWNQLRHQHGKGNCSFPTGSAAGDRAAIPSVESWQQAAEAGRASAQFVLGEVWLGCLNHPVDVARGVKWLQRAAEQDFGPALVALSDLHSSGRAVPRDAKQARTLMQRAAELGVAEAQYQLALRDVQEASAPHDLAAAVARMEKAAQAGHAEAQLALGLIHALGHTGRIDHAAAVKWLSLAAEQHRYAAIEWLEKYGDMAPSEYENALYLESWSPEHVPPMARPSLLGLMISLAFLGLVVAATVKGNSLGIVLLMLFVAIIGHEAGHLAAARLAGIPILVFSIGVGPLLRSFYRRGKRYVTRYDLRMLPLLGYVQPYCVPRGVWDYWQERFRAQEAGKPPPPLPPFDTSQAPQPVIEYVSHPRRLLYSLGGLAANLLLAIACLWYYENATESGRLVTSPIAGRIPPGSLAERAGLQEGDRFLSIAGEHVTGFFDVQRRLAPRDRFGKAQQPKYPPGTSVELKVLRDGRELVLRWMIPPQPPDDKAEEFYGLLPPPSWRVERVHKSAPAALKPGDAILAFHVAGRRVSTAEKGAHRLLHEAFATAGREPVRLEVRRGTYTYSVLVRRIETDSEESGRAKGGASSGVPFELARLQELGPPTGLGEIVVRVGQFGAFLLTQLPQDIVRAVRQSPSEEEKGWFLQEVKKDAWKILRALAVMNMVLLYLNLLPIPPLDGYHAASSLLAMAIRRELPKRGQAMVLRIGWLLILGWLGLQLFLILRDLLGTVFD